MSSGSAHSRPSARLGPGRGCWGFQPGHPRASRCPEPVPATGPGVLAPVARHTFQSGPGSPTRLSPGPLPPAHSPFQLGTWSLRPPLPFLASHGSSYLTLKTREAVAKARKCSNAPRAGKAPVLLVAPCRARRGAHKRVMLYSNKLHLHKPSLVLEEKWLKV